MKPLTYRVAQKGQPRAYEHIEIELAVEFEVDDDLARVRSEVIGSVIDDLYTAKRLDRQRRLEDERQQNEEYRQQNEEQEKVRAAARAAKEAAGELNQPFKVTPEMIADQPTLRDKALAAARIAGAHLGEKLSVEARQKGIELLGVDLPFESTGEPPKVEVDGIVLRWRDVYGDFTASVMVGKDEVSMGRVISIEDLGRALVQAEEYARRMAEQEDAGSEDPDDF